MRRRTIAAAIFISAAACSGQNPPADTRPASSTASVARTSFSVRDDYVGAAAVIRVEDRALKDIELLIEFYVDGKRLGTEGDTLPFCPRATDCPWGQAFLGDYLEGDWRSIDRVDVVVDSDGGAYGGDAEIEELQTTAGELATTVAQNGREGTAYLLAYKGKVPVFGSSFFTKAEERGDRRYPSESFPRSAGDRLRTFLYPGPVPASVYGAAD